MSYNPYQFGGYPAASGRFGQMQPNYPAQIPTAQMAPQTPGMALRPVTSLQEVAASQINFDGSAHWFYDTAGDKIYSKTFDFNTGTAPIVTYVREQPAPPVQFVTVEAFEALMQDLQDVKSELDKLRNRKGKKHEPDLPDE